jgi:hypothetical protein
LFYLFLLGSFVYTKPTVMQTISKNRQILFSFSLILFSSFLLVTADPNTAAAQGTWLRKADYGGGIRGYATGFSIGTKAYLGTGDSGSYHKDFWEWDQPSDTWTQKADFGGTARWAAVSFSIGTKGYLGTGTGAGYKKDFWEYDPALNTWTQKADFGGTGRYGAVGFSIGTKGYIGTGAEGGFSFCKDFWEYDPASDAWTKRSDFGGSWRYGAVGFSIGTKGYIGTGFDNYARNDFWEYDQATDTWSRKTDAGVTVRHVGIGFSVPVLGKGYIGTGLNGNGDHLKDFWEYDQSTDAWTQQPDFPGVARAYSTGFSVGAYGYIGTGEDGTGQNYNLDFWEFSSATTSIKDEVKSEKISVYPNPSAGQFTFSGITSPATVRIYDASGKKVYETVMQNGGETERRTELPDGTYLYSVSGEYEKGGIISSGGLIILH